MSHIVNKNYKTLQNVLLRCPGHFNDYKIPVAQRKNYTSNIIVGAFN